MTQTSLFSPGSGGLEVPSVHERLLTRTTDPATSKRSARKVVQSARRGLSLLAFMECLDIDGDLTCNEAAWSAIRLGYPRTADYWATEFNKRVHGWHVAGHIELTGEERNGGRIWRREQ